MVDIHDGIYFVSVSLADLGSFRGQRADTSTGRPQECSGKGSISLNVFAQLLGPQRTAASLAAIQALSQNVTDLPHPSPRLLWLCWMMKAVVRKGLLKNHKWPKLEPYGPKVTHPGLWKPGTATSQQSSCCLLHQNHTQPTGWLGDSLFPVGTLACKCCWLGGLALPRPVSYRPVCSAIKPHCLVAGSQAAVPLSPLLAPQVWEFISSAPLSRPWSL